jgi:hypothetical protein
MKAKKNPGRLERKLANFDDKISELKELEASADEFDEEYLRNGFKQAYRRLADEFKKQRDKLAATIGVKKK